MLLVMLGLNRLLIKGRTQHPFPWCSYCITSVAAVLFVLALIVLVLFSFHVASILDQDIWSANARLVFNLRTV